ncbi:MAG: hypothetical protein U1F29_08260 [Planctomycetota bacterium]
MGRFLREHALWIVLPLVLVVIALLVLFVFGRDSAASGVYPIF